jgi:serine protease Do
MLAALPAAAVRADVAPEAARKLYQDVTPSLVAVQYAWVSELGRRELVGAGVVVGEDLVMLPIALVSPQIPDAQMKDFKIIVPREQSDPDEIDAVFQGRDERTDMALVKAKTPQHWKPLKFEDVAVRVGEPVLSVGILPQVAAYKSYLMQSQVAALLRGDVPQVMAQSGLAAMGSPVFNADGKALGMVSFRFSTSLLLNDRNDALNSINNTPKFFVPARDFLLTLEDPPTPQKAIELPWMGVPDMTGLTKDVAEAFGLKDQAAVQIGGIIPDSPAAKAGLKQDDIVLKVNGKPLERGDEATELPDIFRRRLLRYKPGQAITLSVMREQDKPVQEIKITLGEQPKRANQAKRYFAEDLGFVVRELVFIDTYTRKLPADYKGVLVDVERPQSNAASGGLHRGDIIISMNNTPVTDIDEFEKAYKAIRKDHPHEAIVLVVQRQNREDTIRIEPPQ